MGKIFDTKNVFPSERLNNNFQYFRFIPVLDVLHFLQKSVKLQ